MSIDIGPDDTLRSTRIMTESMKFAESMKEDVPAVVIIPAACRRFGVVHIDSFMSQIRAYVQPRGAESMVAGLGATVQEALNRLVLALQSSQS